jgi:uncharacterized protein (DUF1330 family)
MQPMPAYMVFEIEVTDRAGYDAYLKAAGPLLAAAGGTFVFSSSDIVPLEGGWQPPSISVVRFEKKEDALLYYHSAEYQEMVAMRARASRARGILAAT